MEIFLVFSIKIFRKSVDINLKKWYDKESTKKEKITQKKKKNRGLYFSKKIFEIFLKKVLTNQNCNSIIKIVLCGTEKSTLKSKQ